MVKSVKNGNILQKVPIPDELSDLLVDIIKDATFKPFIDQRGKPLQKFGILLQPWYDETLCCFKRANFVVVSLESFDAIKDCIQEECGRDAGKAVASTLQGGVKMSNRTSEGTRIKKEISDYGEPYILNMPPVYDEENPLFTEGYDD